MKLTDFNERTRAKLQAQIDADNSRQAAKLESKVDLDNKQGHLKEMEFDIEKLYESYLETGSVHRTADVFNCTGETVRKRLVAGGKKLNRTKWSESELSNLRSAYSSPAGFDIPILAKLFGRTYAAIACKADELGLCCERGKQIRTPLATANHSAAQKEVSSRPEIKTKRAKAVSEAFKKNGHPRGFLGHKRTENELAKMKAGSMAAWADPNHKLNSEEHRQHLSNMASKSASTRPSTNAFSRAKHGVRADVGSMRFRSAWEANYARYLNFLIANNQGIKRWEYEPETFWFEKIKRGCRSYKPDFKVFMVNGAIEYHEVKGWMYPRAKTALKRMAKYHPAVKLVLIDQVRYKAIEKTSKSLIKNWE